MALPCVEHERERDDAVRDEDAEVFSELRLSDELFTGHRRDDEHQVEEYDADEDVRYRRAADGGSAYQYSRYCEHTGLVVAVVGVHRSDVLEEYYLSKAGENRRYDYRYYPRALDWDARGLGDGHVLPYRAHILPELRAAEPDDEEAEYTDDYEGRYRYVYRAYLKRDERVERAAYAGEVYRVAYAVAARKDELRVADRYQAAHSVEDDELIDAVDEESEDVRRNHFAPLGPVENRSADVAEDYRYRHSDYRGEQHSGPACDCPVGDEDEPDLARHRAEDHSEVEPHAR